MPSVPPRLAPTLRRAWYHLNQAFRRRIAASGLTPDQFTALRWLDEHPDGLTQRALADLMASDPNTIAGLVKRLEIAKLVQRLPHADARCRRIVAVAQARKLRSRLQPVASELQEAVIAAVPAAERDRFLRHLAAVAEACAAANQAEARG